MPYIDGFIASVPTANKQAYLEMATKINALFKEHGALEIVENWGADVPEGTLTSFTMAVKREDNESIVFSWIKWPSKRVRDEAWGIVMQNPVMQIQANPPLFDGKRMIFGGFETLMEIR
jgi:uncharacterized protein YbaA (DUF1428 family)